MPWVEVKDCRKCPHSEARRLNVRKNVIGIFCNLNKDKCGETAPFKRRVIMPEWCPLEKGVKNGIDSCNRSFVSG